MIKRRSKEAEDKLFEVLVHIGNHGDIVDYWTRDQINDNNNSWGRVGVTVIEDLPYANDDSKEGK